VKEHFFLVSNKQRNNNLTYETKNSLKSFWSTRVHNTGVYKGAQHRGHVPQRGAPWTQKWPAWHEV